MRAIGEFKIETLPAEKLQNKVTELFVDPYSQSNQKLIDVIKINYRGSRGSVCEYAIALSFYLKY